MRPALDLTLPKEAGAENCGDELPPLLPNKGVGIAVGATPPVALPNTGWVVVAPPKALLPKTGC